MTLLPRCWITAWTAMPAFPLMFQDSLEKNLNLILCDHEIKGKSTGTPISSHAVFSGRREYSDQQPSSLQMTRGLFGGCIAGNLPEKSVIESDCWPCKGEDQSLWRSPHQKTACHSLPRQELAPLFALLFKKKKFFSRLSNGGTHL